MHSQTRPRTGGCLCGAVRYEVSGELRPIVMCHCGQCRRTTGHVMAATAARRAHFRLLADGPLTWYVSSNEARRGFCARCGATLFWEGRGRDYLSITAGSLDDPQGLKVACHIFVADKPPYDATNDGTPQIEDGHFTVPWS
jgi:hypothetical protein